MLLVDMCGYGLIWFRYSRILVDIGIFDRIWEDWGAVAAEIFAKLHRCLPDLRAQVHPPGGLML